MTGFLVIAGIALIGCAFLVVHWWRDDRQGSDQLTGVHDHQIAGNPNRTKAINARQGITIEGETWNDH